jgi:uroporphyrinogen decarboxylase
VTSRDLVRRTLEFDRPPRVPRQAWVLPWAESHHPEAVAMLRALYPDDIMAAPGLYRRPLPVTGSRYEKGLYVDEWGCRFDNVHGGVIGIVREPRIRDWSDLDSFRAPACALDVDREAVKAFRASTERFVLAGTLVRPFERLCFLRTMEQALADLVLRPPGFIELLRRLHEHYLAEVDAWSRTAVDAIVIMDDWGAQDRMLVSPATWRQLFKPLYREYCEVARRAGKFVFMHSDGCITDIVDDLIEVGVQALNSQLKCMGVPELGRRFRGRLTFWGEIDRQEILAFGSTEDVVRAVSEVRAHLYADGGVIAQCEFGPGARPENVFEVFRSWQRLDGREAI